jgi:rSAM/selenodomain-associated transferase 1
MTKPAENGTAILIFAKAPIAGYAKSRLIPTLGEHRAATLHERMTLATVADATAAAIGPVELWCTPTSDHPSFRRCRECYPISLHEQSEGDLGERLGIAHDDAFSRHRHIVIIGTDCPGITPAILHQVDTDLDRSDAVLIPAEDGGYVLIALACACRELFVDIDWSTDRVCSQTIHRFAQAGLHYRLYDPLWDVDRAEDFSRLIRLRPEYAV